MDSKFRLVEDCDPHAAIVRASVGDKSPFEMRFGTVRQSLIPFLKPGYVKNKRQDKLRPKAFPRFFIGRSANCPRDTYEVLLISESKCCSLSPRHIGAVTSFSSCFGRKCAFCICFKEGGKFGSKSPLSGGSG